MTVRIPGAMRTLTGGESRVEVEAATVRQAVDALLELHPGLRPRLLEEDGTIRRFVNLFVGDEDVRHEQGLSTPVGPGQTVSILPAVAGG